MLLTSRSTVLGALLQLDLETEPFQELGGCPLGVGVHPVAVMRQDLIGIGIPPPKQHVLGDFWERDVIAVPVVKDSHPNSVSPTG
jgi:hypothetical protein